MSETNDKHVIAEEFLSYIADYPKIKDIMGMNMSQEEVMDGFKQIWEQKNSLPEEMSEDVEKVNEVVEEISVPEIEVEETSEQVSTPIPEAPSKSSNQEYAERYNNQQSKPVFEYKTYKAPAKSKKQSGGGNQFVNLNFEAMKQYFSPEKTK